MNPTERDEITPDPKCVYPNCHRTRSVRGLCPPHYQAAQHYVKAGLTTWEKLEASGKSLPKQTGRVHTRTSWFLT